jgi:hypothetical protein
MTLQVDTITTLETKKLTPIHDQCPTPNNVDQIEEALVIIAMMIKSLLLKV